MSHWFPDMKVSKVLHFWAKYWHFLPISSHTRSKNNANKVPRWVFHYVGNKTFDVFSKKFSMVSQWNCYIWNEFTPKFRLNSTFFWQARLQNPFWSLSAISSWFGACQSVTFVFSRIDLQMGQEGLTIVFWT